MRRLGEPNSDDRVLRNRRGPRRGERRESRELFRCKRDDLHILTDQDHRIDRHSDRSRINAEKSSETHDDLYSPITRPHHCPHVPQNLLIRNWPQDVLMNQITNPDRLRKSHGRQFGEAHTGGGGIPPGVVL